MGAGQGPSVTGGAGPQRFSLGPLGEGPSRLSRPMKRARHFPEWEFWEQRQNLGPRRGPVSLATHPPGCERVRSDIETPFSTFLRPSVATLFLGPWMLDLGMGAGRRFGSIVESGLGRMIGSSHVTLGTYMLRHHIVESQGCFALPERPFDFWRST